MIHDATGGPRAARPPLPPKVGFDVHVLQDTRHCERQDLYKIGEAAYKLAGFRSNLTPAEVQQTQAADPAKVLGESGVRDMRPMLWSAIDNPNSKDPDQVACAERLPDGNIRIYVGAADVDDLVGQKSPLDQRTLDNMTTVYTDLENFTMLPTELCEDKTVLVQGKDRPALVTEFVVTPQGEVKDKKVYRALVNNHAQLSYPDVDDWFDHPEHVPANMQGVEGMADQLKVQNEAAKWMGGAESAAGRPPMHASAHEHAAVVDGRPHDSQEAQNLVEMQMRTVNRISAEFLLSHGSPALVRSREVTPTAWKQLGALAQARGATLPAVPDNVALQAFMDAQKKASDPRQFQALQKQVSTLLGRPRYTVAVPGHEHELFNMGNPLSARTTGPNRLEQDLVNQRNIKAILAGQPCPYAIGDPVPPGAPLPRLTTDNVTLHQMAEQANRIEKATIDVMRQVENSMAAFSLQDSIRKVLTGTVSGNNKVGSFVTLNGVKADGFVHDQLAKGTPVTVRVDSVDIEKGRIGLSLVQSQQPS